MQNHRKNEEMIKSYHIFMFPFKWTVSTDVETTFEEKTDIKKVIQAIKNNPNWKYKHTDYKQLNPEEYNEYVYFYDNVRLAMFSEKPICEKPENDEDFLSQCVFNYEYNLPNSDSKYLIKIKGKNEEYELSIDSIKLKLYEAGIGILSFHLKNNTQNTNFDDILKINDYGRRIYPQYIDLNDKGIDATKDSFLADSITLNFDNGNRIVKEDFKDSLKNGHCNPYYISKTITEILGENFEIYNPNKTQNEGSNNKIYFKKLLDDRMFVICWLHDKKSKELKYMDKDGNYLYEEPKDWYNLIFVDGNGCECQDKRMLSNLLKEHTYSRWLNHGTFYGFSRYSFVCLTMLNANDIPPLYIHTKTMYYEMVSLLLAQRVGILNFSDEISEISGLEPNSSIIKKIRNLKKNYIQFTNRIYHREVTAQEQGIELYNLLSKCMDIRQNIKDLDQELDSLHQYATLMEDKETNKKLNILTILGAFLAVPALATGFFGMNLGDFVGGGSSDSNVLFNHIWNFTIGTLTLNNEYMIVWFWIAVYVVLPIMLLWGMYIAYAQFKLEDKFDKIINRIKKNKLLLSIVGCISLWIGIYLILLLFSAMVAYIVHLKYSLPIFLLAISGIICWYLKK